jgi:GntR family transcriptional regulator/MocR family aminotransferase
MPLPPDAVPASDAAVSSVAPGDRSSPAAGPDPRSAPDRASAIPIYRQLYQRYKDAIVSGRLRPGDRVPAVRSLASELNLSRGTVDLAYQLLIGEGYLQARGPAGTVVSPQLGRVTEAAPPTAANAASPFEPELLGAVPLPFQMGLPALDAFPRKLWNRLAARRLRSLGVAGLAYPDPAGVHALREQLVAYLGVSRGISCRPDQVFITAGYRGSLDLVCRSLLAPGDRVWFEDPGYLYARHFLTGAGAQLVPVPVDGEGLQVDLGLALAEDARLAVVTPSHQSPLGVSMSLPRRLALLAWARHADSWLIEDDYDSEYRYVGRPLPALKSLDQDDRVLYAGTFSKVMFPALRLSYLVVPRRAVDRFAEACATFQGGCPELWQATVADFMQQGHFARHLKKMRSLYAQRRRFLAQALEQVFGERLRVELQAGGIHLLATLPASADDVALSARAAAAGLSVHALSRWRVATEGAPGLLLSFTNIASADEALRLATRLRSALGWD